jgi:hypothetical protein
MVIPMSEKMDGIYFVISPPGGCGSCGLYETFLFLFLLFYVITGAGSHILVGVLVLFYLLLVACILIPIISGFLLIFFFALFAIMFTICFYVIFRTK